MDIYDLMKQVNDAFNQRYCFSSKRKNSKRYGLTILDNFSLPTCRDCPFLKRTEKQTGSCGGNYQ